MAHGSSALHIPASTLSRSPILVIEDDLDIRETCRQILEYEGYTVLTAANGEQGLEILRRGGVRPALILLDMMMPVMNGWEFLKNRNGDAELRTIPVVVVTAAGRLGGDEPASVQGFLKKPIELEVLLDTVKNVSR